MDVTTCLIIIGGIYGVLLFIDMFFKSCSHYPYIRFLQGTGLRIKCFQIHWQTTALNRSFLRWGNHLKFLNVWFSCGLYITLLLLPLSVILLLVAVSQNFLNSKNNTPHGNVIIEPLIPGINLPGSEIGYYSLSLIISSVIHEMGHALASVKEDVHIINIGINMFIVLPVAYVNLSSESLNSLNPWRALKILCAGIWHNLVLSLVACLLYTTLPYCYSAIFKMNEGIYVREISKTSPLLGPRGLEVNDVITKINLCSVKDDNSLYECLQRAYIDKPGFCVETDIVHELDESVPLRYTNNGLDCCDQTKTDSICFEYIENNDGVLEIPPHACLPARVIIESTKIYCSNHLMCPRKLHCIKPLLENTTSFLRITRLLKQDVIYIGHPADIVQTVVTSSYIPKYFFSHIFFPHETLKFLEYIIVVSTGLALLNVIPCLFMDGQHITNSIVQIIMKEHSKENSRMIATFISLLSTILLVSHCIYTIAIKLMK